MEFQKIQLPTDLVDQSLEIDFDALDNECLIDISEEIKPQPICISIGESLYKGNYYPVPFGSYGDFSCIVGASKSRKTFFQSALVARYIGGNSDYYFNNIKAHDNFDKLVIVFDTEQSKFHTQRIARRITEMVGAVSPRLLVYSVRHLEPKQRIGLFEHLLLEKYKGKVGLAVVDGFVDFLTDFNSLEQSTELTEKLLRLTALCNCHITGILHKNFGSNKPVGHIGSAIMKKAETVVFIESADGQTTVKPEYTRNLAFEEFTFIVDDNYLPRLMQ